MLYCYFFYLFQNFFEDVIVVVIEKYLRDKDYIGRNKD